MILLKRYTGQSMGIFQMETFPCPPGKSGHATLSALTCDNAHRLLSTR